MSIMTSQEQQHVSIAFPCALVKFFSQKNLNSTETLSFKCERDFRGDAVPFQRAQAYFFKNGKLREPAECSK